MIAVTPRRAQGRSERAVAIVCGRGSLVLAETVAGRGRPRLAVLEAVPFTEDLLAAHGSAADCCRAVLPPLVTRCRLHGRRAVVVLESAHTVARLWTSPDLPPRDKLSALGFEAEKWCQVPAADLWLGSLPRLAPAVGQGAPAVRELENELAVAAPAETVFGLLRAVVEAGLEPWGVTVPPLAVESLFAADGSQQATGTMVAVHVGAERSWLSVCAGGRLLMVRELEIARDSLAASLTLIPVEGHGNVRLTLEEAGALLDRVGVVLEDDPFGMAAENLPLESLKFALRPALERLASSISRSLDFCREQYFVEIPETLALTGDGADIPNLDGYLGAHLLARFERGVAWSGRVDLAEGEAAVWERQPGAAAVAAGAALGALAGRALPSRAASLGLPRWFTVPVRRTLVGLAAVLALTFVGTSLQAGLLQARAARESGRVAELKARLEEARAGWRIWEATRAERLLAEAFARDNVRVDGVLKVLSRVVGSDVSLTDLSLPSLNAGLLELGAEAPAGAPGAPGLPQEHGVLTLRGLVRTDRERLETTLARLIVSLENSPYFDNVAFVRSKEEGERVASFELRCRVHQGLRADGETRVVANR